MRCTNPPRQWHMGSLMPCAEPTCRDSVPGECMVISDGRGRFTYARLRWPRPGGVATQWVLVDGPTSWPPGPIAEAKTRKTPHVFVPFDADSCCDMCLYPLSNGANCGRGEDDPIHSQPSTSGPDAPIADKPCSPCPRWRDGQHCFAVGADRITKRCLCGVVVLVGPPEATGP